MSGGKPEQLSLFPNKPAKPLVYVAGPYTNPDPVENTHKMIHFGTRLLKDGVVTPILPNLSLLWHLVTPMSYEQWLAYDFDIIRHCDGLFRLPGSSDGASREVQLAGELGIPVYYNVDNMYRWARAKVAA